MPILTVHDVHKRLTGGVPALQGMELSIEEGEVASLLGPSGCGKTTLLRIIAGLETPDQGQVYFAGLDMRTVPVHQRGFGLMFQDYALFPHRNVAQNIAYGLRVHRMPPRDIQRRVQEMLDLVNLTAMAHRDVSQLSGGEQQRVALARSLAPRPRLLMLDEPLGALDRTLRDRLLEDLRRVLSQVSVTVLYVTHDQGEAFAIADRVIVMANGRAVQVGTPESVYRHPRSAWVARFLGMHNLLLGRWVGTELVETEIGQLQVAGCGEGDTVVLIRPEAATMESQASGAKVPGTLVERSFRGMLLRIVIQCASGMPLAFDLPATTAIPAIGDPLVLTRRPEGIVCLRD
jgi:ABC-type Fe3+/spermidine/putrescine transport system ATPase subunit